MGTPSALVLAQRQLQNTTILEEAVRDPVLRVRLAIERCILDVDVLIAATSKLMFRIVAVLPVRRLVMLTSGKKGGMMRYTSCPAHRPHTHHG